VSTQENKALARRVLEEMFNKGNLNLADEVFAPDYVDHDPAMPEDIRGPEGFKEYVSIFRTAFPDIHLEIEDQVAEGDKVVTRWTGTGTHEGDLMGIAPTGNKVTLPGMEIVRFSGASSQRAGKATTRWY
jgi:predicted ester cyclase